MVPAPLWVTTMAVTVTRGESSILVEFIDVDEFNGKDEFNDFCEFKVSRISSHFIGT